MATLAEQNPKITNFLERNHTAVLATANKEPGQPHAAVVYYTISSKLHLYFVTKRDTAKSRNLEANPQVAMVIYEADAQTHPTSVFQTFGLITRLIKSRVGLFSVWIPTGIPFSKA